MKLLPNLSKLSKSLSVLTLFLFSSEVLAKQDICHALALSGGGNKGSYEAGVIWQLAHSLPPEEVAWDVVSGVSAGAMNTGGASIFKTGDEVAMSEFLVSFWGNLTEKSIVQEWPEGIIHGLLHESGLLDDSPLFNLLSEVINTAPNGVQRKFVVSAADTITGGYRTFDESTPFEDLPTAFISSGSMPAVFPTRPYKGDILMDGGTVWNTNVATAINKCLELVDDRSKIVLDVAVCAHEQVERVEKTGNTISNFLRYRQLKKYYNYMNDVLEEEEAYPGVNFRYTFIPS